MTINRRHILLVHQAFVALDQAGGTRHFEFASYLAQRGHRVTVIASRVSYLTGAQGGTNKEVHEFAEQGGRLTIIRVATVSGLHRSFVHRLINFFSFTVSAFFAGLRVKDVDVVWGTTPPIFQAASAWALARLKGAQFVLEVRDLWPAFAVAVGVLRNRVLIWLSEWLEKFLYKHADRIIINSPGFEDHIRARGGKELRLVPNGADASMFDPNGKGQAFRSAHGLQDKFVLLYAGAHGLSNDLGVVLSAAELLKDAPNIAIVLVGDGKDKHVLKADAVHRNLSNVHFIDSLPKAQMAEALAAADACLAILKPLEMYKTVYPNKVFDYMAAGRPVILAIDGVIREVIEKAGAGIFVQPGDAGALAAAIRAISTKPTEAQVMGAAGRKYLETHFNRVELVGQMQAALLEETRK